MHSRHCDRIAARCSCALLNLRNCTAGIGLSAIRPQNCHPARDLHSGMIPTYFPVVFGVFVLLASHYVAVSEAAHIGVQAAATAAGSTAGEKKVSM